MRFFCESILIPAFPVLLEHTPRVGLPGEFMYKGNQTLPTSYFKRDCENEKSFCRISGKFVDIAADFQTEK